MGNQAREPQGLVLKISSIRKGKNGKTSSKRIVGEGRNGHTGKVAVVKNAEGEVIARFTEPTFAALSTLLRRKYNISPSISIKSKGETRV